MRNAKKLFIIGLLLALNCLNPSQAAARSSQGEENYGISARFTHGGLHLVIENSKQYMFSFLIIQMDIRYCDGAINDGESFGIYHIDISRDLTIIAEKPMNKVKILTTIPNPSGKIAYQTIEVLRSCTPSSPVSQVYCDKVSIANFVHRSLSEPISFSGPPFIHRAGLRIPGVDGLILTQKIHRTFGYHWQRTISYNFRERRWRGTIPTVKIPVGSYQGVELVVQDGFGRQAKCPIGDLTVLP